jgi:hypothetical protein
MQVAPIQAAPIHSAPSTQTAVPAPKPPGAGQPRQGQRLSPTAEAPAAQIISPKTWLVAAALALITLGVVKVGTHENSKPQVAIAPLTPPVAPLASAPDSSLSTQGVVAERAPGQTTVPPTPLTAAPPATAPIPPPMAAAPLKAAPSAAPAPVAAQNSPPAQTTQTASTPKPEPLKTTASQKAVASDRLDSHLEAKASTWVQIVHADGSKTNLRVEAGERVEFNHRSTAAVAFGKPSQMQLTIAGKGIDVQAYVQQASPARALVIMSQLKTGP